MQATPDSRSPLQAGVGDKTPVFVQLASVNGETRFQLMAGSHPVSLQGLDHGKKLGVVITTPKAPGHSTQQDRPSSVVARFEQQAEQGAQRVFEHFSSPPEITAEHSAAENGTKVSQAAAPSRTRTTIPHPLTVLPGSGIDVPLGTLNMRQSSNPAGLGLMLHSKNNIAGGYEQSPTPTVPDDPFEMAKLLHLSRHESIPTTLTPSIDGHVYGDSPNRDFIQHALGSRNAAIAPTLEVPLDLTAAGGLDRFIRTPSNHPHPSSKATPDLSEIERYLEETRDLFEAVSQPRSAPRSLENVIDASLNVDDAQDHPAAYITDVVHQDAPATVPIALQSSLQRLLPSLDGLLEHIRLYPNISTSLQHLSQRVEQLQNASFDHVPPEEFQNKFDHFEGRVLELEGRVDKHDELHTTIEGHLERQRSRRGLTSDAGASFESNISGHSATSSAMIQAAIEKLETEEKLKQIEGRLEILETIAPPSFAAPWEIEVVLLPWGRQLKGIWMTSDDSTQSIASAVGTQKSDEWTQARSRKSMSVDPGNSFGSSHGGWTNQAIYKWADAADEWLLPRACGPSGIVFKRLQSRGFVRNVTLSNAGARHIQSTISTAFKAAIEHLDGAQVEFDDEISIASSDDKVSVKTFLGLREALVPLRKVRKSSRLKFLALSELLTPALWDAQFLNTGVIMHAPGGRRRLFITHRAAYLQYHQREDAGWTWQKLRELPRVANSDNLDDTHPRVVGEADAKESCWAYHASLDPPPTSANSSFGSHFAIESAHKGPASEQSSSHVQDGQLAHKQPLFVHPITPLTTEFRIQRRQSAHSRTNSVPHTASAPSLAPRGSLQRDAPQRRVASFDQPSTTTGIHTTLAPRRHTLEARATEFDGISPRPAVHRVSESPPKTRQAKRRRIVQSSSSQSGDDEEEPLDVLLRVAQGGSPIRRGRQSSSEPLDVLLRVAEGTASLSDAERRVLGSAIERQRWRRHMRDEDADMNARSSEEEDEYMPSGQEDDGSDGYDSEDMHDQPSENDQGLSQATSTTRLARLSQQYNPTFMANPTPRLSREPTSPFVPMLEGPPLLRTVSGGNLSGSGLRPGSTGTTSTNQIGIIEGPALPYATPFSVAGGFLNSCGGDTQADSISLYERLGAGEDEVWEGWAEGEAQRRAHEDDDADMEDEVDDDDDDVNSVYDGEQSHAGGETNGA